VGLYGLYVTCVGSSKLLFTVVSYFDGGKMYIPSMV
jgi:hypothetical protein